jgi:ABC-type branched-subunit amino acid transport system substrate-binding protein
VGSVKPIKVGVLGDAGTDFAYSDPAEEPFNLWRDFVAALRLTFDELEERTIGRPIEMIVRVADGLPRGDAHSVLQAWQELADDGCLVVYGPCVSENAVALREHIETVGKVPTLSWAGSENFLGQWCFGLNNGSLTEEPPVLVNIIAQDGIRRVGVIVGRSLIGQEYLEGFRAACPVEALEITVEVAVPQIEDSKRDAVVKLRESNPDALVCLGNGYELWGINEALAEIGWVVPRYTNTALELAYYRKEWMQQLAGWTGLEQYDERNQTGQQFLDRFAARYGYRPEFFAPLYAHDGGRVIGQALATARPLSPRGVMEALERVKMLPSALGTPDTRISFGKWLRRGWMGPGYLVARQVVDEGTHTVFRGSMGPPVRRSAG